MNQEKSGDFDALLDVTQDDLRKLGDICHIVTSKYVGKPKDIKIFAELKHELETRCYDAGFVVEVSPRSVMLPNGVSVWQPDCAIVGKVDKVEFDPEKIAAERGSAPNGLIL